MSSFSGMCFDDIDGSKVCKITSLIEAVIKSSYEDVLCNLDKGADVNESLEDSGGLTPLIIAAAICDPVMIKLLVEYGADPEIAGSSGLLPVHMWVNCDIPSEENPVDQARAVVGHAEILALLY